MRPPSWTLWFCTELGNVRQRLKSKLGSTSFKVPGGKSCGVHANASVEATVIATRRHIGIRQGMQLCGTRQAKEHDMPIQLAAIFGRSSFPFLVCGSRCNWMLLFHL